MISRSLAPELAPLTTCQSRTPASTITNQNTTVLTVEFTRDSCVTGPTHFRPKTLRCRRQDPDVVFASLSAFSPGRERDGRKDLIAADTVLGRRELAASTAIDTYPGE